MKSFDAPEVTQLRTTGDYQMSATKGTFSYNGTIRKSGLHEKQMYGLGIPIAPNRPGKTASEHDKSIYLDKLLPLEEYDLIIVLFSGGKDSTAAYFHLIEMGVPKSKIELWHHDLDGGHPSRLMDWPVTQAYVRAFSESEEVRLRISQRVNGFWGEVYRIGASYPIEYEDDDGSFVQCKSSEKQYRSDHLRGQIIEMLLGKADCCYENSAELSRSWCARCEELLLQDIVTVEMDKLDQIGNERVFPGLLLAEGGERNQLAREHILKIMQQDVLTRHDNNVHMPEISKDIIKGIADLKHLQPFHLRLPAIQGILRGRYCTSVGKAKVFNRSLIEMTGKTPIKVLVISGERREESKTRAGYNEVELHQTNATKRGKRLVHWWRPVIDHEERDVWDSIRRHRCVPHPVYTCGWNRCSCMLCIFSKREQWAGIRELFPAEYRRLANDERILGFHMHIGMSLDEYVGDAESCVYHGDKKALNQLVTGKFTKEDIICTGNWEYPAGAFRGSEGGPC